MPTEEGRISLGQLLEEAGLTLRANPLGPPHPVTRDLAYNAALLFMTMRQMGRATPRTPDHLAINETVARFVHFACKHPRVVAEYEEWYVHRHGRQDRSMLLWPGLPRGYLSDTVFERTAQFLAALGHISWQGTELLLPCAEDCMSQSWLAAIDRDGLFARERSLLERLQMHRVTKTALGAE